MTEPISPFPPPPKKSPGPWLGVAGCGITFALTLLGTAVGGWIGWLTSPPPPAQRANEYSGLNELFTTLAHLAVGLAGGAIVGLLAGIVMTTILCRRKPAENPGWRCGTLPQGLRKRSARGWRRWFGRR